MTDQRLPQVSIVNTDGARPGLSVVQQPVTAHGLAALDVVQADSTGTAVKATGAGTLLDLRNAAAAQQFKVDGSGNVTAAGTLTVAGAPVANMDLLTQPLASAVAATFPRGRATAASGALTSGTLYLNQIPLPGGITTAKCTMFTNTTAKTGGTHGWYVLADANLKVVAVTADQTDAATVWGVAGTGYPLSWTAPYTVPATALYYVGVMVAESAGGTPTISSATAPASGIAGAVGITSGIVQCGSSNTGATTPPAVGATLTTLSAFGSYQLYAYLE